MFAYNEKIKLTVMNVRDRNGRLLPINISLPLNVKNINLPENISQLSIIEYHEGIEIYGHRAFNIYVGKTGTIEEILNIRKKIKINDNFNNDFKNSKELLVYSQRDTEVLDIFASVHGNDIVVEDIEELEKVLKDISREFSIIKKSVAKIRKLRKK